MIIAKFGGTSVGSVDRVQNVIRIIQALHKEHGRVAVVVSAFGKTTDKLIELAHQAAAGDTAYVRTLQSIISDHRMALNSLVGPELLEETTAQVDEMFKDLNNVVHGIFLIRELTRRSLDFIMSFGERLSAFIISRGVTSAGLAADFLDARTVVRTDAQFSAARVDFTVTGQAIRAYFDNHPNVQLITGFVGSTADGVTTTLGRGGSDYTASFFGAILDVTEIQIWTDVDGVMTADPRTVPAAFPIANLSYEEAMELSHFGARVIYPPTMQPALDKNIPIRIKNSFNSDFPGTRIARFDPELSGPVVKGISSIEQVALLRLQGSGMIGVAGIANRLFGALARQEINIILITQASSEHSICFAVQPDEAAHAKAVIESEFELELAAHRIDPVVIETDLSIVAIVGEGMRRTSGISGRMFQALGVNGINVAAIAQGSSELNISVVIPQVDEAKALRALHEAFFLSDHKTLNLFIVGVGLIGSTLIRQLLAHASILLEEQSLEIRVVAVANSRQMHFNETGIDLDAWHERLSADPEPMTLDAFIQRMNQLNLQNSIFVDCTASEDVVARYGDVLSSSISIVTPNKKANTGPYESYRYLKTLAARHGVKYLYETNVGAALPIISTLNDLVNSGDRIQRIEAILSGTISYIFNEFVGERTFSDIVNQAMDKGYTEPDPRDDLNGLDVARKLLILAREIGYPLEMGDLDVENIVPESCREAPTVEQFLNDLQAEDAHFETLKKQAHDDGRVLRYIATLDGETRRIALQTVGPAHPFYDLSGSDNIIAFTTERYRDRPLVVKGPGAGAEVTAAGVFADLVRLGHYLA